MKLQIISKNVGVVLLLNALFMAISAAVAAFYNFDSSFSPLLLSALITTLAGLLPLTYGKVPDNLKIREGFTLLIAAWMSSSLFGMIPYLLYGGEFTPINSWFEAVSGYTTTGATILTDVESLPKGLLFWRSSTHWLGGLGVILFMLLILPTLGSFGLKLSKMELSPLSKSNFKFRVKETVRIISALYLAFTLVEALLLTLCGMELFDAINHSFSTVATGGFSTKNLSILHYDSRAIEFVITLFMFLSGIHFGLLYYLFIGKTKPLFRSSTVGYYLIATLLGTLLIAINIWYNQTLPTFGESLRVALFQVVSTTTTTGFAIADTSLWPSFSLLILLFFLLQGAPSGSTPGAIKADRVQLFFLSLRAHLKKELHPNALLPVKVDGKVVDRELLNSVSLFIVLYLMVIFVGTVLLSLMGLSLMDSFSASAAAMGNGGPGFGSIGSLSNYAHFPSAAKLLLSIEMIMGRLELYALLLLFLIFNKRG